MAQSPYITIPLLGYAPDLDPAQPGVFSYCLGMESTLRGWKLRRTTTSASSISDSNYTSGSYVLDGLVSNVVDGTQVIHLAAYEQTAGKLKLYRDASGTLTDCSRGAFYTASGTENFVFAQYGNYTVATNNVDVIQIRDASGTGAFADSAATGIPKAKIAVTFGPPAAQRMMLLDYDDGTRYPDGWWVSGYGGPTAAWTPDIATGAANNRLYGAGPIRCGIAYRDMIVAWGDRQMWIGRVADPPFMMDWQRISEELGCCGPYAARVLNGVLYWVGKQGLFSFDGQGIRKVQVPIQQELITTIAGLGTSERLVQVTVDGGGQRLMIALRASGYGASQTVGKRYSINILNGRVGIIGPRVNSLSSIVTMACFDGKYTSTISSGIVLRLESSSAPTATLAETYGFGLNYIGSDVEDTKILRVVPRFSDFGNAAYYLTDYYGPTMSEALSNTASQVTVSGTPYRADFLQSARWHAPRMYFVCSSGPDPEVIDVLVRAVKAGEA